MTPRFEVRQQAILAGNVLGGLAWQAERVKAMTSTLLPYACALQAPCRPLEVSVEPMNEQRDSDVVPTGDMADSTYYRAWFPSWQDLDWRESGGVIRQIGMSGRAIVTVYGNSSRQSISIAAEGANAKALPKGLAGIVPGLELVEQKAPLRLIKYLQGKGRRLEILRYQPSTPYWRAFPRPSCLSSPTLHGALVALSQLRSGLGFYQIAFERAAHEWIANVAAAQEEELRALKFRHVGDWSYDGIQANKELIPNTPVYAVVLRCGVCVRAPDAERAIEIVSRPWRGIYHGSRPLSSLGTAEYVAALGTVQRVGRMLTQGEVHAPGCLMTEDEFVGFVHLLPKEVLGDQRLKLDVVYGPPVPSRLRTGGTQIGLQRHANRCYPVAIPHRVRTRHVSVEGKTGSGKTVTLYNLVSGDLENGFAKGALVIDLQGESERLLDYVGEEWKEKTVYCKPAIPGRVFRYNPFANKTGDIAKRTDDIVSSVELLFRSNEWGAVIRSDCRMISHLLCAGDGLCFEDARTIASHGADGDKLRQEVLPRVENMEVLRFWEQDFPQRKPGQMSRVLQKLSDMVSQCRMFSQADNVVDWHKFISEGWLVIMNLAIGRLGGRTADTLASLLLSGAFQAAMARVAEGQDLPTFVIYVDEAQRIATKVTEEVVTQLRKANVPLVMAVQSRDQMADGARVAMRNIETLVALNASYDDARRFAHEFGGEVDPNQFLRRPVGTGWALVDGHTVQLQMLPPRKPRNRSYANAILQKSYERDYLSEDAYKQLVTARRERRLLRPSRKATRGYDMI